MNNVVVLGVFDWDMENALASHSIESENKTAFSSFLRTAETSCRLELLDSSSISYFISLLLFVSISLTNFCRIT